MAKPEVVLVTGSIDYLLNIGGVTTRVLPDTGTGAQAVFTPRLEAVTTAVDDEVSTVMPVVADIDSQGRLVVNGALSFELTHLSSEGLTHRIPEGQGTWQVSFRNVYVNGEYKPLSAFWIVPTTGGTNELSRMLTTRASGQVVAKGDPGDSLDDFTQTAIDKIRPIIAGNLGSEITLPPGAPGGSDTSFAQFVATQGTQTRAEALNLSAFAQGKVFTPEQYGAVGDGSTNDYPAFKALYTAVNTAGGGSIVLSRKTYYLGSHIVSGNGVTDLAFTGCAGLSIMGYGAVVSVKGDFDRNVASTRAIQPFRFNNCTNVAVQGLEVDGNVDLMTNSVGATEPASQLLAFYGTRGIALRDLNLHHGSCDGMTFSKFGTTTSRDVVADNVTCDYNARLGTAIVYLYGAVFNNCRFTNTAQSTGTYGGHDPRAGIDVEPNFAASSGNVDIDTGNLTFINCRFVNNQGQQFVAVFSDRIQNVTHKDCIFDAGTSLAAASVVNLSVNGGTIEGGTIISRRAGTPAILPTYNIAGHQIRTTLRGVRIRALDRAVQLTLNPLSVLMEECRIEMTGTTPPDTAGRMIFISGGASNFTLRGGKVIIPAAMYGGSGSGYEAATFLAGNLIDGVSFETDLVPTTTEHFSMGLSAPTVMNARFNSVAVRPAASSIHDPAQPFGRGDFAAGNKQWIGRGSNGSGSAVSQSAGTAAPTTGTWKRGEAVFNTTPASGAPLGWVCVAAGTPGTWASIGGVQAVTATTANLTSAAAAINTTDKFLGKMVYNTNLNRPVYATGSAATSAWNYGDGTVAHTPA